MRWRDRFMSSDRYPANRWPGTKDGGAEWWTYSHVFGDSCMSCPARQSAGWVVAAAGRKSPVFLYFFDHELEVLKTVDCKGPRSTRTSSPLPHPLLPPRASPRTTLVHLCTTNVPAILSSLWRRGQQEARVRRLPRQRAWAGKFLTCTLDKTTDPSRAVSSHSGVAL